MFKVQTKVYTYGKRWQDTRNGKRFASLADAWRWVESMDQDGYRDTANYRVVACS